MDRIVSMSCASNADLALGRFRGHGAEGEEKNGGGSQESAHETPCGRRRVPVS